jgi:hypothetical protein
LYVGAVIGAGTAVLVVFAPRTLPNLATVAIFLASMLLVSLFKLRIPIGRGPWTISMAYVVDFVVIVNAGADLAMVIAAAGVLVQCLVRVRRPQPWYRTAFSMAAVVLAVQAAGSVWSQRGDIAALIPLAAAVVVYFAVNGGLVAVAIALSRRTSQVSAPATT